MGRYSLDGLIVDVIEGDITEADTDAIANAANNHLWMGSGVAGAIKHNGGEQIEREAVARGPIEVGSAIATTAGDLPHEYVIHGAVMGQDLETSAELISGTTESCLDRADELGLSSVALPAFGGAIDRFTERRKRLERVALVLFGREAFDAFAMVAGEKWGDR